MTVATDFADLGALTAAIARSPIVVASPAPPARDFADWCERQKPASIDDVILNWLRSQAPARSHVLS
jgi:hypothetical protein